MNTTSKPGRGKRLVVRLLVTGIVACAAVWLVSQSAIAQKLVADLVMPIGLVWMMLSAVCIGRQRGAFTRGGVSGCVTLTSSSASCLELLIDAQGRQDGREGVAAPKNGHI